MMLEFFQPYWKGMRRRVLRRERIEIKPDAERRWMNL
jgi:hypothetical protein